MSERARRSAPSWAALRAYALRESAELLLIVLGLGIADAWTVVPHWVWLALPLGKVTTSIGFYVLFLRTHLHRPPRHDVTTMIGRRARTLTPLHPLGQVKIDGEIWDARSADGTVLPAGSTVSISAVEGRRLLVEPRDRTSPLQQG